jgi:hypothetical protein
LKYRTNATLGQKLIILVTAQIFEIKLKNLPNLSNGFKFIKSSTCRFIGAKLNKKANISILPKFSNGSKFKSRPAQSRKWMKLNIGQIPPKRRVGTVHPFGDTPPSMRCRSFFLRNSREGRQGNVLLKHPAHCVITQLLSFSPTEQEAPRSDPTAARAGHPLRGRLSEAGRRKPSGQC